LFVKKPKTWPLIPPGISHGIDQPAQRAPVLGLIAAGLELDLLTLKSPLGREKKRK
jgi:hypothetical protein